MFKKKYLCNGLLFLALLATNVANANIETFLLEAYNEDCAITSQWSTEVDSTRQLYTGKSEYAIGKRKQGNEKSTYGCLINLEKQLFEKEYETCWQTGFYFSDYQDNYETNMRENTPQQYAQKYGRFCSFKQKKHSVFFVISKGHMQCEFMCKRK